MQRSDWTNEETEFVLHQSELVQTQIRDRWLHARLPILIAREQLNQLSMGISGSPNAISEVWPLLGNRAGRKIASDFDAQEPSGGPDRTFKSIWLAEVGILVREVHRC